MAKSARASSKKNNKTKLKSRVFGPVESARTERLSAKLIELVSQPRSQAKPAGEADNESSSADAAKQNAPSVSFDQGNQTENMDVDQNDTQIPRASNTSKNRISKKRAARSKASIVFPRYKDGKRVGPVRKRR